MPKRPARAAAQQPSALEHIAAATDELEARIAASPFSQALHEGSLPVDSYVVLLRVLAMVLRTLDQMVDPSDEPVLAAIRNRYAPRLPLLQADLQSFAAEVVDDIPDATLRGLVLIDQLRERVDEEPSALAGYLYAFATLGRAIPAEAVARQFGRQPADGVSYLQSSASPDEQPPRELGRLLDGHGVERGQRGPIVDAVQEAFDGIAGIIEALYPIPPKVVHSQVAALNREAGRHPIPEDPREILAALRAGTRTWRKFPYYGLRYGERGRRFTRSDSAWLVTLVEHPQEVVDQQIAWLGRLLAARGMPRWLLEQHLRMLHEELVEAAPEKRDDYGRLLHAAQRLGDERREHLTDEDFDALAAEFKARAGGRGLRQIPEAGRLLIAAVADEASGINNAVRSIEGWLTDPERFSDVWRKAARATIRRARGVMR